MPLGREGCCFTNGLGGLLQGAEPAGVPVLGFEGAAEHVEESGAARILR